MNLHAIKRRLKNATPKIICPVVDVERDHVESDAGVTVGTPFIRAVEPVQEVVSEGFDPKAPRGCVYWRIVRRAGRRYYLSTMLAPREAVERILGEQGLACCDSDGSAVVCVETALPDGAGLEHAQIH